MAWNEPGGNQKKPDPWGSGKKPTPPDFNNLWQEVKKQWQKMRSHLPNPSDPRWGRINTFVSRYGHYAFPALLFSIWLATGITSVDAGQEAVVLHMGKYSKTLAPGMHWIPPFIDKAYLVDRQQINTINYSDNVMTGDKQLLVLKMNVQYRIANAQTYLFAMTDPVHSLDEAIGIVSNQIMGAQSATRLLTESHQSISQMMMLALNQTLPVQLGGVVITDIAVQTLDVPTAVADAHADVLKAQQDNQQAMQLAQDTASQTLSQMQIRAQRLLADAHAYQQKGVLKAEGNTARYLALLPEYQQNPKATRTRLYVETMQNVLSKMTKVFVDTSANSPIQITIPSSAMRSSNNRHVDEESSDTENSTTETETDETAPITGDGVSGYGNPSNSY
jgi:membrane protease subunit HflK